VAATYNFTIDQGTTVSIQWAYKTAAGAVIDLTNYTARLQARPTVSSSITVMDCTTANGQLTVTGATGVVTLALTAVESAALDFNSAVYDLEIVSPAGAVIRLVQGTVTLSREVTR